MGGGGVFEGISNPLVTKVKTNYVWQCLLSKVGCVGLKGAGIQQVTVKTTHCIPFSGLCSANGESLRTDDGQEEGTDFIVL